jgi:malate dehydrogenase
MYPDLFNAKVNGERAWDAIDDEAWVADEFIPRVGKRGAEVLEARGASSAASAANAAIDHVRDWVAGADGLRSMAVASDGSYGVAEGIISSFPVRCADGAYAIEQGLEVGEFAQAKLDATVKELTDERAAVSTLGLI